MKSLTKKQQREIFETLSKEESRLRRVLEDDAGDVKDLQSGWQERDSPSENNLRTVEWSQFSSLTDALTEIEAAKERLKEGVYGICETCDEEISPQRLLALPAARLCVACQESAESQSGGRGRPVTL
ncbi:MAG: TraR/DksA C4-type zinc finger protein [Acidobacteriota bacterium]|nr:TraR/DksA C4-type zinc finger protein [Acidobacteriota bacterium]MDH3529845.1 TraR/DksA C4-type zinc finger protein [Acidobacteriota bacterium]